MKQLKESSVHSRALWVFTMWSIKVGLNSTEETRKKTKEERDIST